MSKGTDLINLEFMSELGGTVVWTPGEVTQEHMAELTPEEFEKLSNLLARLFNTFTLTLGCSLLGDAQSQEMMCRLYSSHLSRFVSLLKTGVHLHAEVEGIFGDIDPDSIG